LHRKFPDAIIIVTGCYAQLQPEQISHIPGVDYVLGQNEKYDIPALIEELEKRTEGENKIRVAAIREIDEFHGVHSADDRTRCFIKVQDGCNYFCTYCTIPFARGKSRNPRIEEVIKDAQSALDQGAKELIITGVNIGDFGRSTGENFIDLLRAFDRLNGDYRVRISSCEPNLLTDEIIDFVANSNHFAPHFHIPLQSGSNEVLAIMKRRYTRELFAERVQHIRKVMPHAFIGVDCMVGVRGETQDCWEDYLTFIKGLDVSQLHVFTYSERANTRMLEMDLYVVPKAERQRRSKILHEVSEDKTKDFYAQHAGRKSIVLWESKKEGDQMSGFTDNYIKVYGPYKKEKINTFEEIVL
jgi:threonylcarbamoyladenosine tRNA methylthiotransferase MtaB